MGSRNRSSGFTIVELMFAMAFLSVLLIIVLIAVMQTTRTYNKGITLKRVNQSGRTVGAELQRSIKSSNPQRVVFNNSTKRLCLGSYSYAWNIDGDDQNKYSDGGVVGFTKVRDPSNSLCGTPLQPVNRSEAVELIGDGLIMQEVSMRTVSPTQPGSVSGLYSVTYQISTPGTELVNDACPTNSDGDFCALNKFTVIAYAKRL